MKVGSFPDRAGGADPKPALSYVHSDAFTVFSQFRSIQNRGFCNCGQGWPSGFSLQGLGFRARGWSAEQEKVEHCKSM